MFKLVVAVVFVVFGAFNVYAAMECGYLSVFPPFKTLSETQMFADLGMALSLFGLWMISDVKKQGRSFLVAILFMISMAAFGSMGALLYLLIRKTEPAQGSSASP